MDTRTRTLVMMLLTGLLVGCETEEPSEVVAGVAPAALHGSHEGCGHEPSNGEPALPATTTLPVNDHFSSATTRNQKPEPKDRITITNDVVEENSPIGTTVGALATTWTNKALVHFELVGGSLQFRIANGVLETKCDPNFHIAGYCLNYEERRVHHVTVRAIGGGDVLETTLAIQVKDVPDGPSVHVDFPPVVDMYALPYTHVGNIVLKGHDPDVHPGIRHRIEVVSEPLATAFTLFDGDQIQTLEYGKLASLTTDSVTLRITTSYAASPSSDPPGFGEYPIATNDVSVAISPSPPPLPATGTNPLRFVVDSDILSHHSMSEVRARLTDYVAELNAIFGRNTIRQFSFDPNTSIRVLDSDNHDVENPGCVRSPYHHFTMYLISEWPGTTSSGSAGCGRRGEDEWSATVYDVNRLCGPGACPGSKTYEHIVYLMAHELGHNHGLHDNYNFAAMPDTTGVLPDNAIVPPNVDLQSAYWAPRWRTWHDLMGTVAPGVSPLHALKFAPTHADIINEYASAQIGDPTLMTGALFDVSGDFSLAATVVDDANLPITGCQVEAIRQTEERDGFVLTNLDSATTDSSGIATLSMHNSRRYGAWDVVFFKASCAGYAPAGDVITLGDLMAWRRFPQTNGVHGGFNTRLLLRTQPTTAAGSK